MASDMVNHPPHYRPLIGVDFECIDVVRAMTFDPGNAVKYLWRTELKNGREDVDKARWYLEDALRNGCRVFTDWDSAVTREARRKLHRLADVETDPERRRFWLAMRDDSLILAVTSIHEMLAHPN